MPTKIVTPEQVKRNLHRYGRKIQEGYAKMNPQQQKTLLEGLAFAQTAKINLKTVNE